MSSREIEPARSPEQRDARKVVLIGFGSPIRGDDALGPLVADWAAERLRDRRVEVLSRHILTAEIADTLRGATLVLLVDASTEGTVGEIHQRQLEPRRDVSEAIAHSVDAPGLLAWTEALYGHAPPAILLSTRAVTFDYANYELSDPVAATVEPLLRRLSELVDDHLAGGTLDDHGSARPQCRV
jgi:hydrogenase maturation protease